MKKNWKTEALKNDDLVAEQLLLLKRSSSSILSSPEETTKPLRWGIRGRRSGLPLPVQHQQQPARISPTTPLSWSGGSNGAAKQPKSRSQKSKRDMRVSQTTVAKEKLKESINPKSIEKQGIDKLKEKETQLKKEKTRLKKDLASVRDALKNEKKRRDHLKKLKVLYDEKTISEAIALYSDQGKLMGDSSIPMTENKHAKENDSILAPALPSISSPAAQKDSGIHFSIPDLNTMPIEYEQSPPRR